MTVQSVLSMRWLPGDLLLIWGGVTMTVLAALAGVYAAVPPPVVLDPVHKAVADAIHAHVQEGVHNGALTRDEALTAFSALSGILLVLVGAVYRSAVSRLQDLAQTQAALSAEVHGVKEAFVEHRGETTGKLDGIGVRLDSISTAQAQTQDNLIDVVSKNNETHVALLREMQERKR